MESRYPKEVEDCIKRSKEMNHEILQLQEVKGLANGSSVYNIITTLTGASFWLHAFIYEGGVFRSEDTVLLGTYDLKIIKKYLEQREETE